jgi:hypothetical protein
MRLQAEMLVEHAWRRRAAPGAETNAKALLMPVATGTDYKVQSDEN